MGMPVSDADLLEDLKRVSTQIGRDTVPQKVYRDDTTVISHFRTWNGALTKAGLNVSHENDYSDEKLFENLLVLWQHYGRQPRRSELASHPSTISQSPYARRFGSWSTALQRFVEFANASEAEPVKSDQVETPTSRRTPRDPSLRLRFKVLQRDQFRCVQCGASPAKTPDIVLHVDHVVAWSKGGETTEENLQTLCSKCNLGKGDQ
jgi:hypothetical protein